VANPTSPSHLMTFQETAIFLGISQRTLSRWNLHRVGPPRIKIGARVLYRRAALLDWLQNHEAEPLRSFSGSGEVV